MYCNFSKLRLCNTPNSSSLGLVTSNSIIRGASWGTVSKFSRYCPFFRKITLSDTFSTSKSCCELSIRAIGWFTELAIILRSSNITCCASTSKLPKGSSSSNSSGLRKRVRASSKRILYPDDSAFQFKSLYFQSPNLAIISKVRGSFSSGGVP